VGSASTLVKECVELYNNSPQYVFMAWCSVKKKHRENFTCAFNFHIFIVPLSCLYHTFACPVMKTGLNIIPFNVYIFKYISVNL